MIDKKHERVKKVKMEILQLNDFCRISAKNHALMKIIYFWSKSTL
jgi:hypothetical protein